MSRIDGVQAANESLIEIAKIGAMAALRAPRMAKSNIMVEILTGEDPLEQGNWHSSCIENVTITCIDDFLVEEKNCGALGCLNGRCL